MKCYCENENDKKIIGTSLNKEMIALKNLKAEEHMFVANKIYSSYYWIEGTNGDKKGLVIDVAIADDVVDEVNKKLS